jgi:hypothetical protein
MQRTFQDLVSVSAFDHETLGALVDRVSYYDLVLAVIPLAFLASALVSEVLSLSGTTTIAAASVVAGLAVVDALFFNPPGTDR